MNEEWRDIKGYEGLYQISNLGRVKSLARATNNQYGKVDKILSTTPDTGGYLHLNLCKNGKSKPFKVHRLVALHFIDNPNNYKEVNHKDENKQNNKVDNLEWCTSKYNCNYGTRTKRQSEKIKGSKHPNSRKVQCITTGKKFNFIKEAAEYYSINKDSISNCCRGKSKSAGKHPDTGEKLVWKYLE